MAVIRPATPPDIAAMMELLDALFRIEVDFAPHADKQRRGLELLLERGDQACVLVAEHAGHIVGMVTAQVLVSTAEGAHVALVEDLIVRESDRGRGIGRQLIWAVEQWCANRGLARMQLLADCNNASALEFYRRQHWGMTQLVAMRKQPIRP